MPRVRRKYLSPDEARRLIEAAGKVGSQGERDKLMLTLMYRHGLRVSEVIFCDGPISTSTHHAIALSTCAA